MLRGVLMGIGEMGRGRDRFIAPSVELERRVHVTREKFPHPSLTEDAINRS
jgi:hypothetical protein